MGRQPRFFMVGAFLALAASGATLGGCGDDDDELLPQVIIGGQFSVKLGQTLQLTATTAQGSDASYSWASDDPSVATVDRDGLVTALALGETTITAVGSDSEAVGRHPLVVVPLAQGTPLVKISGDGFMQVREQNQLTAVTLNGEDSGYSWSSSDEVVATVSDTGTVTAHHQGTAVITAVGLDTEATGVFSVVVFVQIPYLEAWAASGHASATAEAFTHWDEEDPPEVPTSCAGCHSTPGYLDRLGADGSPAGSVEQAVPAGSVIECQACHNPAASSLTAVSFPSGVTAERLGASARCMLCHQGRASSDDVQQAIEEAQLTTDPDLPSAELSFVNIHYYAAAATLLGGQVRGGFQYEGKVYDWRFAHVPGYESCADCHDPHRLEVKISECASCHAGVESVQDLRNLRSIASAGIDFDGDGDVQEGVYDELIGLQAKLYQAMRAYALAEGLPAICYSAVSYPYFFKDTDGDGDCGEEEASFANSYDAWTARLLKAGYNYQVSQKDPGAFAHNAKYMIQLLYDSIEDLNSQLETPVDLSQAVRNDKGHFNGASEAARHWDEDVAVEADCARCHSGAEGYTFYLEHGVNIEVPDKANGLDCATCHTSFADDFALRDVDQVTFASGVTITRPDSQSNLCAVCHSGRASRLTVDRAILAEDYRLINVHYLPAAATRQGGAAHVGYEYPGQSYVGAASGHPGGDECTSCHIPLASQHSFLVADNFDVCTICHTGAQTPDDIRSALRPDYDNDGSTEEPLAGELQTLAEVLLLGIQLQAASSGPAVCYAAGRYPYFFVDSNGDGSCDGGEAIFPNGYSAWTPELMRAAFNYQLYQVEPGAWAHNLEYMVQLLVDSIAALGGDVSGFIRPEG